VDGQAVDPAECLQLPEVLCYQAEFRCADLSAEHLVTHSRKSRTQEPSQSLFLTASNLEMVLSEQNCIQLQLLDTKAVLSGGISRTIDKK